MRLRRTTTTIGLLIALAACGTVGPEERPVAAPTECRPIDLHALTLGPIYDHFELFTPAEYAKLAAAVVEVRLIAIHPGYVVVDRAENAKFHYVVAELEVTDEIVVNDPNVMHHGRVYVRLPQGAIVAGTGAPLYSVERFRKALPTGLRAVLFLGRPRDDLPLEGQPAGLPSGARLLATDGQGILVDDCGKLARVEDPWPGWEKYQSLEDVAEELRRDSL